MTVTKVTDGYTVKNTATQIVNDVKKDTNTVTNPLKPINPVKDVTLKVGGDSVNGQGAGLCRRSRCPQASHRSWRSACRPCTGRGWRGSATRPDTCHAGCQACPCTTDATGTQLFDVAYKDGVITANATDAFLKLVSADTEHEQAWTLFISTQRIATSERVENTFTETFNDKEAGDGGAVRVVAVGVLEGAFDVHGLAGLEDQRIPVVGVFEVHDAAVAEDGLIGELQILGTVDCALARLVGFARVGDGEHDGASTA